MDNDKRILDLKEACAFLGLKPSYVYKLTMSGVLPFSKPNGKKIYFDRAKLEAWMLSGARPGKRERDIEAATYVSTQK